MEWDMPIRAIPTRYAGCKFRSRLEARWAVFFDALGLNWEHEPEGFFLPSGERYLPDFWLHSLGVYAEVKPVGGDFGKAQELAEASRTPVWLCEGPPSHGWQRFAGGLWPVAYYRKDKQRLWWGFGEESSGNTPSNDADVVAASVAAKSARFGR